MRVVVTGGAGYIGSHVVRALLDGGHDVRVLDDLSTGHRALVKANGVPLHEGDVGDPRVLDVALRGVDAVVHCAGKALVEESVRDPGPYFRVNCEAGRALLDGMRRNDVARIVFSSTCAVYGRPPLPIREDSPRNPLNPYGHSKLAFEYVLDAYARAHGLRALALRYFNVAGASAKGDLGELHEPETHVIPNALNAARTGTPFNLFGDDFPTRDGTCERDYVHVEDLARAHRIAVEKLDALPPLDERGLGLNLGTGRGSTVREVVAAVEQATGKKLDVKRAPRRAGDPPALVADAGRAKELLGFKAELDLGSMVRSALGFMERHQPGSRS